MTTLQIKAVLSTAETGSISAAAKELQIAQSNASNSIKALEDELGFAIFVRTKSGAILTEKGSIFISHARQMLTEQEKIMNIRHIDEIYRLRVGAINYYTCLDPFLSLCRAHRDDAKTDMRFYNISVDEGISKLISRELDVIITPVLASQVTGLRSACKENNLSLVSLCTIPAVVHVREGHPAALDGRCRNLVQGSDAMKDFPYVAYRNLSGDDAATGYNDSRFVDSSYIIYVDSVDVRLRTVAETNGFSFGALTTDNELKRFGVLSFPVPGITLEAFCITRSGEAMSCEVKEYLDLLSEEIHSSLHI